MGSKVSIDDLPHTRALRTCYLSENLRMFLLLLVKLIYVAKVKRCYLDFVLQECHWPSLFLQGKAHFTEAREPYVCWVCSEQFLRRSNLPEKTWVPWSSPDGCCLPRASLFLRVVFEQEQGRRSSVAFLPTEAKPRLGLPGDYART